MSAEFMQAAEAAKQTIEQTKDPIEKANEYQELANKALESFYISVNKLVDGDDSMALQTAAYNKVDQMFKDIQQYVDGISEGTLVDHNSRMIDVTVNENLQSLIQLGSATKEQLDQLIDRGLTDTDGDFDIDNKYQLDAAVQKIMEIQIAQTSDSNTSPKKEEGTWDLIEDGKTNIKSAYNIEERMKKAGL